MPLDDVWALLLAVAAARRAGTLPDASAGLCLASSAARRLCIVAADAAHAVLVRSSDGRFAAGAALDGPARDFAELYLPLLDASAARPVVLAHLGQSVDNGIATASGDSRTVTGHEDFVHMHRLRALADAIVVGGGTVAADDPTLTTRLVEGPSPVRVVLDPAGRLDGTAGVFDDGLAPTLHVRRAGCVHPSTRRSTRAETLDIETEADAVITPAMVLERLHARGLHAVFIEGGGVTVTRWIEAGAVDRLQLVVAPVLIGQGRAALSLPSATSMRESLRPAYRLYRLGEDVLWDFDLRAPAAGTPSASSDESSSARPSWARLL